MTYYDYVRQGPAHHAAPRRKRGRVFPWIFLALQVIFVIWLIAGISANHKDMTQGVTAADTKAATQMCDNDQWKYLSPGDTLSGQPGSKSDATYTSEAACIADQARDQAAISRAGATAGTGIGAAIIVVVWVVVDFFLGLGYLIFRLARR